MSLVGLLSDSHGRASITRRAALQLRTEGATVLVHLGDVGSELVIDALAPEPVPDSQATDALIPETHLVFGNTDYDPQLLARYARRLGIGVHDSVGRITIGGKSLVFLHGHDSAALARELAARPDFLCHGHSHQTRDEKIGPTRVVNPGALFRAAVYTVALLDTDADRVRFLPIDSH